MTIDQPTQHFHAGSNDPGYLPDSAPACFATYAEAKSWMIAELNLDADNVASWADPHDCDDIPCPAYGDDCPASKGDSLSATAEDLNLDNGPEWAEVVAGRSYWITAVPNDDCDDFEPEPEHVPAGNPWPKTPSMTRAHFDYLARVLVAARSEGLAVDRLAGIFAYHLADTNQRFNSERFIDAATA